MRSKKTELNSVRLGVLLLATGALAATGCKSNDLITRSPGQPSGQDFRSLQSFEDPYNRNQNSWANGMRPGSPEWQAEQERRRKEDAEARQKRDDEKRAAQAKIDEFRKKASEALAEKYDLRDTNDCPFEECNGPDGETYRAIWKELQTRAKNLAERNRRTQESTPEFQYQKIAPWVQDALSSTLALRTVPHNADDDKDHDGIPNDTEIELRKSNPVKYGMLDPNLANGYRSMVRTYTEDDLETAAGNETVSGWKTFGVSMNDFTLMGGIRISQHDNLFNLKLANVFEKAKNNESSLVVGRRLWKAGIDPRPQVAGDEYGVYLESIGEMRPSVLLGVIPENDQFTAILSGGWKEPLFFNAADGVKGAFVYDVITGVNSNTQTVVQEGERLGVMIEWYGLFPGGADVIIGGAEEILPDGTGQLSQRAAAAFLLIQNETLVATSLNLTKKYKTIQNRKILDTKGCPSKFTAFLWTKSDKNPTEWIRENVFVKEPSKTTAKFDLFQQHTAVAAYPKGGFPGCTDAMNGKLKTYEVLGDIGYQQVASDPITFASAQTEATPTTTSTQPPQTSTTALPTAETTPPATPAKMLESIKADGVRKRNLVWNDLIAWINKVAHTTDVNNETPSLIPQQQQDKFDKLLKAANKVSAMQMLVANSKIIKEAKKAVVKLDTAIKNYYKELMGR